MREQGIEAPVQELTQLRGPEDLPRNLSTSGIPKRNREAPKATAKGDGTLSCFFRGTLKVLRPKGYVPEDRP